MIKNYFSGFIILLISIVFTSWSSFSYAQESAGMDVKTENYTSFLPSTQKITPELDEATSPALRSHPEYGKLPSGAPCEDCYEVLEDRTKFTRNFVRYGTDGREYLSQTGYSPLNYMKDGLWRSVDSRLKPTGSVGIYKAPDQIAPTELNMVENYAKISFQGQEFVINKNLVLVHENEDGQETYFEDADWSTYTAGNDGAYVTNIFTDIDMVMKVGNGRVKTNFIVKNQLPFSSGSIIIRDDIEYPQNLNIDQMQSTTSHTGELDFVDNAGTTIFELGEVVAYDAVANKDLADRFEYRLNGDDLEMVIPMTWLNNSQLQYPITIDPTLTANTTLVQGLITGSGYNATCFVGGCNYNMNATIPANVTITDIQWSFDYQALGLCWMSDGAVTFNINGCPSPNVAGFYWFCNNTNPGTCTGANISLWGDVSGCAPPPACGTPTIPCTMTFYRCFTAGGGCASTCIGAASDWVMTVIGETVDEPNPPTSSAGNTICEGSSTDLTATAAFGVPPYTYSWDNGGGVGNPVTVSPTVTTTYTCTITDNCGVTATNNITITVVPAPDAGNNANVSFCSTDPVTSLLSVLGGTPDATGTWGGPSVLGGGSAGNFNPATMNAGVYTYTVTGTAPCANANATVTVTLDPAPDAGTNGATAFCPSDAPADLYGFLGGTPDLGGTWAPALTSGTGVFDPGADPGGTYTYTVTNPCGSISADVVVTLNVDPDPGTNGATSFCPADAPADLYGFLGGTPDLGGTWAPAMTSGTGVFDPGSDPAGTYTYTVTNGCGSLSADVVVTLDPAPDAGTNGATSFCSADAPADLYGFLGGTPDLGGTWAPAMTSGTGVFDPGSDPAGTYTYTVTNGCGSISADVVVTFNPDPNAGTNGTLTICSTDPPSDLFNELGGTPDLGGTWAPGLTSGTGVFDPGADPAGTYTYTVTNGCGSISADIVVTITANPDAGTNGATSFCPSDAPADLYGFLGGTPDLGGTWAPALTSGTGVFDPGVDGAGTYTYTITASCGTASADVVVTLDPDPDAGTNGAITFCPADAPADLYNSLGGTPDLGGTWAPALTSGTGVFDPGADAAGTYTYTVTTVCGSISADVVVTLDPNPDAGTNGANAFCASDTPADLYGFLGGTPDLGGTWAPALTSGTGVFDPGADVAGTYTYTVTNSCGSISADVVVTLNPDPDAGTNGAISFCPGDPASDLFAELGGAPDVGGTWAPALTSGSGVFDPGADAPGTYTYTVTNGCGSVSADVVVTINANPDPGTNGATSFCSTDAPADLFGFLGGTPDIGGTWTPALASGTGVFDPGVDAGGTYTYTMNACGGGTLTADVVVTLNPSPDAGTNGTLTICDSDPATDLFASLGGTPDAGGTWAPALTSGTGVFDPGVDAAGTYTYTVTNTCGTATADVVVTVNNCAPPLAGFTLSDTVICLGDCITLTDTSTMNPVTLDWDFGGSSTPDSSDLSIVTICPDATGTFTISLTAANGNGSTTATATITVGGVPSVLGVGDTVISLGDQTQLTSVVNPLGGTYSWTDGNGDGTIDCPTCPDVTVTPVLSTDYVLTYTSAFGCTASDTVNVYVTVIDLVDVPNGFSPNGDGENDVLYVKGDGISYMEFAIFNRYGQKVFQTDSQNVGWDGTYRGTPENPGVFVWYVQYTLIDGTTNLKKGNVTLIK